MDIAESNDDDDRRIIDHPIRGGDSSSLSSPDSAVILTPASNGGEVEDDGPADPFLLRSGQDEVYELREGVGRGKSTTATEGLLFDEEEDDDGDYYHHDEDDDNIVYTADEERAVVRKFDRRLVLFVALLYLLSFLDRSSECPFFLVFAEVSHGSFLFWDWCLDRLILPAYDRWFCILSTTLSKNHFRVPSDPQGSAVAFSCVMFGRVENASVP